MPPRPPAGSLASAGSPLPSAGSSLASAGELHHGSHAVLLQDEDVPDDASVSSRLDAVIVPTAWPADALRHVMQVGKEIDCTVVALCSRAATSSDALAIADHEGTRALAVDVTPALADRLPSFATDRLLHDSGFGATSDLSLKRNLGLLLARGSGWRRVLFLDDDILIDDPAHLHRVAGLVDRYRAVGLRNHGYEDNSVICHAYRAVGGRQDTFIGGGAMIVDALRSESFFPNIYNEDWFYLLGGGVPFRAARAGAMSQRDYDPFANPSRALAEELGDTLAEGLFWLLDSGPTPTAGATPTLNAVKNEDYWGAALHRRRAFIDLVITLTDDPRIRRSLEAARGRSADITYGLCHRFVDLWQHDLHRWRHYLTRVPICPGPEKFLHQVAMSGYVHYSASYLNSQR
ncbi:hypothetical protein [Actinoplanes utahensis]|uniref:hypothetical protein n=1 Tax=Actinoplanes utahensis TaxID=1869 RepID=UPI00068D08F7|nr:hypothetical protein [Actinoplanes utahensis]GIF34470.1 hypothetical protein Aut01nite_74560 [Actinoplanes utahensis]